MPPDLARWLSWSINFSPRQGLPTSDSKFKAGKSRCFRASKRKREVASQARTERRAIGHRRTLRTSPAGIVHTLHPWSLRPSLVDGDQVDHMAKFISYLATWSRSFLSRISGVPVIPKVAVGNFQAATLPYGPESRTAISAAPGTVPFQRRTVDHRRDRANVYRGKRTSFRRRVARKTETESPGLDGLGPGEWAEHIGNACMTLMRWPIDQVHWEKESNSQT